jgi:xanthine dehydrogenase small subunit
MTSKSIKFIFENKIHEIKNPDSNETILNYVRLNLKKTGTKEGCAEGGCGACTIVLGELKNNNIIYKAINSCIAFVTSLEGKQLIIIEDLLSKKGSLHPVQNAMVKYHGSQCGFCTGCKDPFFDNKSSIIISCLPSRLVTKAMQEFIAL